MAALEKVMQMKKEGKSDNEIIATLRNEGVSPMEISDALNQSRIKEAISEPNPTEGMSPSIMDTETPAQDTSTTQQTPAPDIYSPQPATEPQPPQSMQQYAPQETYTPQEQTYAPQETYAPSASENYAPQEQAYSPQDYGGGYQDEGGYQDYGGYGSTDAMIEVAEQVFEEKIKKLGKDLKELREFKTIFETNVRNIDERLKRMERSFDKMQLDILGKVSEYGKGLDYMKKELNMVQDSFGKMTGKL